DLHPETHARSRRKLRRDEAPAPVEGRVARGPSLDHGGAHAVHHALAVDGRFRGPHLRAQPPQSRLPGPRQPQHSARHRSGPRDCHSRHHPRPGAFRKTGSKKMSVAVDFKNVDIIFGKDIPKTLAMVDAGATRAEILAKTGAVLGAAGANLTVNEGEISVL